MANQMVSQEVESREAILRVSQEASPRAMMIQRRAAQSLMMMTLTSEMLMMVMLEEERKEAEYQAATQLATHQHANDAKMSSH
jgi:hypothetical protein